MARTRSRLLSLFFGLAMAVAPGAAAAARAVPLPEPAAACVSVEGKFATMFMALSAQALSSAGKPAADLGTAGTADRVVLEALVAALGISLDDRALAEFTAGFPTGPGLPFAANGSC